MKDSALYLHIPFCDHKCIYCDFYSIITKDNIPSFLDTVKKEISFYSPLYSKSRYFSSIFFGGGTPSLMEADYIGAIISSLKHYYSVNSDAEVTLETNPGTVDKSKLKSFLNNGINRISIGIQSFDDDDLKFLTRIHDKNTAVNTVLSAIEAGFNNVSIDLIFNLPGQTKEKWMENLKQAVKLPVTNISAYSLIVERGTILNKMIIDGKTSISDDDYDAELYQLTIDFLESEGFYQYEVSNFARPGYESRHNNAYWRYRDYLSFGPSAHSFMDGKRWWNYSSLKKYIGEIEAYGEAAAGSEILTDEQKLDEYIMLALRSSGLNLPEFKSMYIEEGNNWLSKNKPYLSELASRGFILMDDNVIKLSKNGYALCDEILTNIL